MTTPGTRTWIAAAALASVVLVGADALAHEGEGSGADTEQVMRDRHETMTSLGGAMRAIRQFLEGRASAEDAAGATAAIRGAADRIPGLFPAGTGMETFPKSEARPEIWERWGEFMEASAILGEKADALQAALAGEDAEEIATAFGALARQGCSGCHKTFREKR